MPPAGPRLNGNGYHPPGGGYPPNYPGYPNGSRSAPSVVESMVKLFFARWSVLFVIAIVGVAASYATVKKYGKQNYSVNGVMTYSVPDDYNQRKLFPPPKLETIMQLVQSPDVIEKAIKDTKSPIPLDQVISRMRVQNVQMSDNISITLDSSEKDNTDQLVNRIMELAREKYLKLRNDSYETTLARIDNDSKAAQKAQNDSQRRYSEKLKEFDIADPKHEVETLVKEISELSGKVTQQESRGRTLDEEIQKHEKLIEEQTPSVDPQNPQKGGHLTTDQMTLLIKCKGDLEQATAEFKIYESSYKQKKPAAERGYIPLDDIRDIELKLIKAKTSVDALKKTIAALEQPPDPRGGQLAPLPLNDPLAEYRKALAAMKIEKVSLPFLLHNMRATLKEKKDRLQTIANANQVLQPLEQENGEHGTAVAARNKEKAELNQFRAMISDPHTSELRITGRASGGPAAVSSNYMKLSAAVFGLLFLLYGVYLAAFELPKVMKNQTPPSPQNNGHAPDRYYAQSNLPVPVLGHFAPMTMSTGRYVSSPPPPTAEVHSLAAGLAASFREPGSIVLFTPMGDGVQIEKLVSELSRHYANAGESVLLFDVRGVSTPLSMAMTGSRSGAIDSYLDGEVAEPSSCFTPTQFPSVEYTRGDIANTTTGGAIALYRFRQLLDEMRNRYSKVLMIGPAARNVDEVEVLTAFSEGVVLVVQDEANPTDVNAYVDAMKHTDAPIFGAVVVGNPLR